MTSIFPGVGTLADTNANGRHPGVPDGPADRHHEDSPDQDVVDLRLEVRHLGSCSGVGGV